jgi:cysteine desulfurase
MADVEIYGSQPSRRRCVRVESRVMKAIYLDYAATAPLLPEVLEAMMPFLESRFGNPSSVHAAGRTARHAVESSRESVAALLGAAPEEVVFTSGGTESNFLAVEGLPQGRRILTGAAEHDAILRPVQRLGGLVLEPDAAGRADPESVRKAVQGFSMVSFMLVNNELGSINDIQALAEVGHSSGALVHCDAVQAPAAMSLDVDALGVDLMTLSGHKLGGPKGIGVLYVRSGTDWAPPMQGGGQERNRRGGTENVPGIVGFATALGLQVQGLSGRAARLRDLNDALRAALLEGLGERIVFNSPAAGSAPHILNVGFPGIAPVEGSEMVVLGLDLEGVQVSAGAACSSGVVNPSHVLSSIGRGGDAAVRFSMGYATDEDEIARAAEATARVLQRVGSV